MELQVVTMLTKDFIAGFPLWFSIIFSKQFFYRILSGECFQVNSYFKPSQRSYCTFPITIWQSLLCNLTKTVIIWLIKLYKEEPSQTTLQNCFRCPWWGWTRQIRSQGKCMLLEHDSDAGIFCDPFPLFQSSHSVEHMKIFFLILWQTSFVI